MNSSTYIVFGSNDLTRPDAAAGFPNDNAARAAFRGNNYKNDASMYKQYNGTDVHAIPGVTVSAEQMNKARDYALVPPNGAAKIFNGLTSKQAQVVQGKYPRSRMFTAPSSNMYGEVGKPLIDVMKLGSNAAVMGVGRFTEKKLEAEYAGLKSGESIFMKDHRV